MKKFIPLLLAVAIAPAMSLQAQDPGEGGGKPPKPHGPPPWEMLQDELGLTDAQLEKLEAHRKAQREKMKAIREDDSLTKKEEREKMKALMEAGRTEVEAILTPAQIEKMKQLREERKEGRQGKKGPGGPDGPPPQE